MNDYVCTSCGYRGPAAPYGCVSIGVTIFLGLFLLIPGLIYAAWMDSRRKRVCPVCEQSALVPASTPRGREVIERYNLAIPAAATEVSTATAGEVAPKMFTPNEAAVSEGDGSITAGKVAIGITILAIALVGLVALSVQFSGNTKTTEIPQSAVTQTEAITVSEPNSPPTSTETTTASQIDPGVSSAAMVTTPVVEAPKAPPPRVPEPPNQSAAAPERSDAAASPIVSQPSPEDRLTQIRRRAEEKDAVFTDVDPSLNMRVYHEPNCPSITVQILPRLSVIARKEAIPNGYSPAWDCHRPQ